MLLLYHEYNGWLIYSLMVTDGYSRNSLAQGTTVYFYNTSNQIKHFKTLVDKK